jgi:hypothetical protein
MEIMIAFLFLKVKNKTSKVWKKGLKNHFFINFPLIDKVFSHCYSKKRIILEKMLIPKSDLYEFKIVVVNNDIKVIYERFYYKDKLKLIYYDSNYVLYIIKNQWNLLIYLILTKPYWKK